MEYEPQGEKRESPLEAQKRIQEICHPLIRAARKRLGAVRMFHRLRERAAELEEKYTHAYRYLWFHVMRGSSLNQFPNDISAEDFPGADSVEKFLRSLAEGK